LAPPRAIADRTQAVCPYLYRLRQPSLFRSAVYVLDYQRNNVKVIASDAGVTACHNGGTHMSFEDMGIVAVGAFGGAGSDRCGDV
jgi:hypothetical protein